MAKTKHDDLGFIYCPRSQGQQLAEELWKRSRVLFLIGPAGTGKTAAALGLALREVLRTEKAKLILTRPMVACEEDPGLLPGDIGQKLGPWLGPFHDVFGSLSTSEWSSLERTLEKRLEVVPVGMMRGRTVRNGVLVCDESQNVSYSQLKCLLTRVGDGGRLILCGDPDQSDRYTPKQSPLNDVAKRLRDLDAVCEVRFSPADQLRDPLVSDILDRL